jgi:repressor LexA
MIKLTKRQEQILNLIKDTMLLTGAPPTRSEIAAQMGYRSVNAAEEHLQALSRKGVIEVTPGIARGIRIANYDPASALRKNKSYSKDVDSLENSYNYLTLPLVGNVAAGSPIFSEELIEKTFQVDPLLFTSKPDFLVRVRGMSMRDAGIIEGDLLAVKKVLNVKDGQIVVARIGSEVTVKRYFKTKNGIDLMPENPDYAPIRLNNKHKDSSIEGVAVGLLRPWI